MIDDLLRFALAPVRARRQFNALLLRADPEFVRCAYLTAAGREPTAREYSGVLARLATGASRTAILRELVAASTNFPDRTGPWWLHSALGRERLGRLPLLRTVTQLPLNPLPWILRLVFRRFIDEDPRAAFVVLERVPAREAGEVDPVDSRVADRVYKDLSTAAAPKARQDN